MSQYAVGFIFLSASFIYCSLHTFPHFLFFASVFSQVTFFLRFLFHFSKLQHFTQSLRRIFKQDFQDISRRVKCGLLIPQSYKKQEKSIPHDSLQTCTFEMLIFIFIFIMQRWIAPFFTSSLQFWKIAKGIRNSLQFKLKNFPPNPWIV